MAPEGVRRWWGYSAWTELPSWMLEMVRSTRLIRKGLCCLMIDWVCVGVCVCVCYSGEKREQHVICNLSVCVCVWWREFDSSLGLLSGKNATLLIHEATLEDGMEEEACEKRHRWSRTLQICRVIASVFNSVLWWRLSSHLYMALYTIQSRFTVLNRKITEAVMKTSKTRQN